MNLFDISVSGTKEHVIDYINANVENPQLKTALHSIVTAAPGNRVSLQGSMDGTTKGTYGQINLVGSFWTV